MSKINNNPLLKGASGMLGDVVVYRQVRGNVIMANKPKKSNIVTENQKPVRDKFKKAVNYAKRQMLDATAKTEYANKISAKLASAYMVALRDFLISPTVDQLDLSGYDGEIGDKILIQASDDFKVESVFVSILNASDAVIESGAAVQNPNGEWEYTATVVNSNVTSTKYQIQAKDKPGNITTAQFPA